MQTELQSQLSPERNIYQKYTSNTPLPHSFKYVLLLVKLISETKLYVFHFLFDKCQLPGVLQCVLLRLQETDIQTQSLLNIPQYKKKKLKI